MEYMTIAYGLIAVVLISYAVNLRARLITVKQRHERFETKDD